MTPFAPAIVTATPSFYGAWIGYSDELDYTSFDPFVSEVSGILGEQAGVSADTLVRNVITDGATKDYSGNKTAQALCIELDARVDEVLAETSKK